MSRCIETFPEIFYNTAQTRFWLANDKKFYNKFQALSHDKNVSFHVHDDEFSTVERKKYDLDELLKQRAIQLRNNFDYIRIWYSGGKDSLTVIDSFLNAGCKIDEIATILTSPIENPYSTCDIEYTVAEKDLADRGLTRNFYRSNLSHYEKIYLHTESFFEKISHGNAFLRTSRPNAIYTLWPELLKQTNCGMSVAEIGGDQRPTLHKKDGQTWFYFLDTQMNHLGAGNFEDFFVSGDMPELLIAQAQGLSKYLDSVARDENEWNYYASIDKMPNLESSLSRAKAYGRTLPSHIILTSNVFGKAHQNLKYFNYKHQCAAGELNSSPAGQKVLLAYDAQLKKLQNKYQFDSAIFPVGSYTVFHNLDNNSTADNREIIV